MTHKEQRPWRATAKAVEGDTSSPNPTRSGTTADSPPEAADLATLTAVLSRLADHLERQARVPMDRLVYRLDDLVDLLGVSRRAIERERAAGRFPKADVIVGRMPLWRPESIRAWLESQAARQGHPRGRGTT